MNQWMEDICFSLSLSLACSLALPFEHLKISKTFKKKQRNQALAQTLVQRVDM